MNVQLQHVANHWDDTAPNYDKEIFNVFKNDKNKNKETWVKEDTEYSTILEKAGYKIAKKATKINVNYLLAIRTGY